MRYTKGVQQSNGCSCIERRECWDNVPQDDHQHPISEGQRKPKRKVYYNQLLVLEDFAWCLPLSLLLQTEPLQSKRESYIWVIYKIRENTIVIYSDYTPSFVWLVCSTDLLINPFTIKSVAVHKRPTAVKLMFMSVFWVP